jgi:hypothetical protein
MLPRRNQDVRGLHVAMHEAPGVRGREPCRHVPCKGDDRLDRQRARREACFQCGTVDEGHGDEGAAVLLARLVHGADVRAVDPGGGLRLAAENAGAPRGQRQDRAAGTSARRAVAAGCPLPGPPRPSRRGPVRGRCDSGWRRAVRRPRHGRMLATWPSGCCGSIDYRRAGKNTQKGKSRLESYTARISSVRPTLALRRTRRLWHQRRCQAVGEPRRRLEDTSGPLTTKSRPQGADSYSSVCAPPAPAKSGGARATARSVGDRDARRFDR